MPESVLRFQHILFYLYLWLYTNKSVRSPINPMTSIASPDTEICL